ncbi:YqaI family protein [Heyndrickxia coagulans]|uniref:Uncharacterized protein n=1 Tax=Heyndrickxia coagulans DSM 1 = ATCC 7050 TaxID=1121088 RepID=A0A0B5X0K2_HEYCO|nr:hypothetical protein [Heyndrickxia coagulans]AJH77682.1 putative Yqai family protein [Heyndrickxia coagulans DSM 1 = ATCC 7050]AJH79934.1 putative Yqai family protein [Heyndrickxia coagulans DSM 1 = ATCC 7050]MED4492943.1 hypothetical protein [Heyndrickxia coagulans]MED4535168.1 hypothetical protein [Heyndrickxia coagulans]UYM81099.1 hypothetical protein OF848_12145 [Heyndrickxia coagulans]
MINTIEHPDITRVRRFGYLQNNEPELFGYDYFGDEIFYGDDVVEMDGEIVLQDNLQKFLVELYDAKFYTA